LPEVVLKQEDEMAVQEKKSLISKYNLPEKVKFCTKCVISNQRPRITFDENGVCSACRFAEKKKIIDWDQREKELRVLCDKYRRNDGYWDVVVPASGGKDSIRVAHMLKTKYNMKPLTVTWAPHIYTDVGWRNMQHMIHSGLDNILGTPNGKVHRVLTKLATEKLGDPFQPFIYGQKAFPMQTAVKYKIPLVMYGENGEVEYGGDDKNADKPTHNVSTDMIKHYFSGISPEDWAKYGVDKNDLQYYYPPTEEEVASIGMENHFFSYYKKWVPQENYYYSVENTGFEPEPDGRSEGTYSKYASLDDRLAGYHNYFAYIKFGLGRATSDAAHEIRDGHITREEGVALVRKFDGELPRKHFKEFLEYIDITEEKWWGIVDSYRSEHLWEKVDGKWKLRNPVS
jgi:N-acetyl sugar amidotransferase